MSARSEWIVGRSRAFMNNPGLDFDVAVSVGAPHDQALSQRQ